MKIYSTIDFIPFYNKVKEQPMPAKTAYRLAKIYQAVQNDFTFYQDHLSKILHKYGELDEKGDLIPIDDGKGIKLKPGVQDDCLAEIQELQDIESEIHFEPIPIDELKDTELTPKDLEEIMEFLA